jgi:hypothetical protein
MAAIVVVDPLSFMAIIGTSDSSLLATSAASTFGPSDSYSA